MLLRKLTPALAITCAFGLASCGGDTPADATATTTENLEAAAELPYKISLAQWSLNKKYRFNGGNPYGFAADAKALGFEAVEYVNQIYVADIERGANHAASVDRLLQRLDSAANANGVFENLMMIDGEGNLGTSDEAARKEAVRNHKHYIDALSASDIKTMRVNAAGEGDRATVHAQAVKSLSELGKYGALKDVNVAVENHGGHSSDPRWLADVMADVDMDNVGILPDFGNFCRAYNNGTYNDGCADSVPADSIYAAVALWMPWAKAVSAKAFDFTETGDETTIDFRRMMDTVRAYGYTGYVGIEYEGEVTGEEDGIEATRVLLERVGFP